LEIVGNGAIGQRRRLIGPTNLEVTKRDAPNSLRALYARNTTENLAHGSDCPTSAQRELGIIYSQKCVQLISQLENTTCCVVKPHAVKAGLAGKIVSAGFKLRMAVMVTLDI
jgi:nucleoside-diphosphate kinase